VQTQRRAYRRPLPLAARQDAMRQRLRREKDEHRAAQARAHQETRRASSRAHNTLVSTLVHFRYRYHEKFQDVVHGEEKKFARVDLVDLATYNRQQERELDEEREYNRLHAVKTSWSRIREHAKYVCVEEV
jgi:hypothetical protein